MSTTGQLPPQPEQWYPPQQKRRRRKWPWIVAGIVAVPIAAISVASALSPKTTIMPTPPPSVQAAPSTQAIPSPTIMPANKVVFVISGQVAPNQYGEVDITYGSDSDTHDVVLGSLSGTVRYSVPFDPNAQYYSVDVNFTAAGSVKCKIVVKGPPPDAPLVAAKGSASASGSLGGNICSAQAAPSDSTGESWIQE